MRIVIDLQACQGVEQTEATAKFSLALAKAIATVGATHEFCLFLNADNANDLHEIKQEFEGLISPDHIVCWSPAVENSAAGNGGSSDWGRQANEIMREHFLAALNPDFVLVTNRFDDYQSNIVTSIGAIKSNFQTAVVMVDTDKRGRPDLELGNERLRRSFARKVESLKKADLIFTASDEAHSFAMNIVGKDNERLVRLNTTNGGMSEIARIALYTLSQTTRKSSERSSARINAPGFKKPKLAFVSPLPPLHTGIADYSSKLLLELVKYYEIVLIAEQPSVELAEELSLLTVQHSNWYHANAQQFDYVLFQMGNSIAHRYMLDLMETRSGVVVMHDFFLTGLWTGIKSADAESTVMTDEVYRSHGYDALIDVQNFKNQYAIWKYPSNFKIFEKSEGVIVHSDYPRRLANQFYGKGFADSWSLVPHLKSPTARTKRDEVRARLGLEEDDILICTFGFVCVEKLPDRILEAWTASSLSKDSKCRLVFAGHNMSLDILSQIRDLPSSDRIDTTGYLSAQEYLDYLDACDIAVQLRQSSRGESSGATADCLGKGLPTIINAHGSFNDIPDHAALKLNEFFATEELVAALENLRKDKALRQRLSENAHAFVTETWLPEKIGQLYYEAIELQTEIDPAARRRSLARDIARIIADDEPQAAQYGQLAEAIAKQHRSPRLPQVFVDISEICSQVAKVAKEPQDMSASQMAPRLKKMRELLAENRGHTRLEPVYRDANNSYKYARKFVMNLLGLQTDLTDEVIDRSEQDQLISLTTAGVN